MANIAVINNETAVRAGVIAQRTGSIEMGMVKAMMIENLKNKMKNGVAHFVFKKKDGSLREAWGTIQSALADAMTNGRGESRENYACCAFYSVTDGAWRSFRWENLVTVY